MNPGYDKLSQIQFLARIVKKEKRHLLLTGQRLFSELFTREKAERLGADIDMAERVVVQTQKGHGCVYAG